MAKETLVLTEKAQADVRRIGAVLNRYPRTVRINMVRYFWNELLGVNFDVAETIDAGTRRGGATLLSISGGRARARARTRRAA